LPRVAYIEGDVSTLPEVSLEALENLTDVTVTAELINGTSYVLRNAWTKGRSTSTHMTGNSAFGSRACPVTR